MVKSTQIYLDDFLYYITVATVTYSYSITTTAMQYCPNQLKTAEILKWLEHTPKLWTTSQNMDSNRNYI